ncbi:MAG: PAS domain S-box protein [Desulfococcus multivorans]|nr:PAS domain S-box protein [Desulfococcus multivorans]
MKPDTMMLPRWILILLLTALMIVTTGGLGLYRAQEDAVRRKVAEDLVAVARLKGDQIAAWRTDQLEDAAALKEHGYLRQSVVRFTSDPGAENAEDLRERFRILATQHDYTDILLTDPTGRMLSSLSGKRYAQGVYATDLAAAVHEKTPVLMDIHTDPQGQTPHISVIAPLFSNDEAVSTPVGAVILVIDAARFLYPLIQSWPTGSETAETLLVRQDGEHVLFLNDLRHQPDTALKLRIPLTRTDMPAVMAVLGREGFVRGRDYRGVEVVSVIRPIPDSPWFMVTKVDTTEVFAEWRRQSVLIWALLAGATVLIGAIAILLRQHERNIHFRALYVSEAALRNSLERYGITLKSIGDAVIVADARGMVELLNPAAEALTGWGDVEAHGKPLDEILRIVDEETGKTVESLPAKVLREGAVIGLTRHPLLIARDGTRRPIADSGAPIRDADGEIIGVVLVFRDQTEERRARRTSEIRSDLIEYAATHTLDEMMTRALEIVTERVESPSGWFGFVETDSHTPSGARGQTPALIGFHRTGEQIPNDPIEPTDAIAECVRRNKPIIRNDDIPSKGRQVSGDGGIRRYRELVVPVIHKDQTVAVLGVSGKQGDYTDKEAAELASLSDMIWEIAARKRTEADRQKAEQRYRRLFESAGDGILVLNADTGRVLDANPSLLRMVDMSHETIVGKDLGELGPFTRMTLFEDALETLQGKNVFHCEDAALETADGRIVEIEFVGTSYRVDHNRIIQFNIRDITRRKQVEIERERLLSAIEQAGETIVMTDPDGVIQYVNPAFERVTGYTRREAVGQTPCALENRSQDDAYYGILRETLAIGRVFQGRMVNQRKDGTLLTQEVTIAPVRDAAGRTVNYVGVAHDITENLAMAAQLQQAQKLESVGRLAGGVAHDYNNMLGVILGYTELALKKVDPSDPLHDDLMEIFDAARRSSEITRQLLAFARRQTVSPRVLDVNETVEGMLKMLRHLIGEDIDLRWFPKHRSWPVKIDPSQIEQILANLCLNARDAISGVGKVMIETENITFDEAYCAHHPDCIPGEYVLLAASDDGRGMDKETLESIFEPFFTTKDVRRGTGLGLATVYGIVKQNNGFINVYSEPGKGTTFKIYLPRHQGPATTSSPDPPVEIPLGRGETILLVEDEPAILKVGAMMLEGLGYRVLTADTPTSAMRLADAHVDKIHLLVTDVVMPEMNGRDLANQLKARCPEIRTLFMSGYTANVIAHRGVLDVGVYFIQKPFSRKDLGIKVRGILDETSPQASRQGVTK